MPFVPAVSLVQLVVLSLHVHDVFLAVIFIFRLFHFLVDSFWRVTGVGKEVATVETDLFPKGEW